MASGEITLSYRPEMEIGAGWNTATNERAEIPFEVKLSEDSIQVTEINKLEAKTEWYTNSDELIGITENATAEGNFGNTLSAHATGRVKWLLDRYVIKKECGFVFTEQHRAEQSLLQGIDSLVLTDDAKTDLTEGTFAANYGDSLVIGLIYGSSVSVKAASETTTDEEVREFRAEVGRALEGSIGNFVDGTYQMGEEKAFEPMESRTQWKAECRGVSLDTFSKYGSSFAEIVSSAGKMDLVQYEAGPTGTPIMAILLPYERIQTLLEAGFPGFPNKNEPLMNDIAASWVRTAQAKAILKQFSPASTPWADTTVTQAYHNLSSLTQSFYFNFDEIDATNPGGKPWNIGTSRTHPMVTCGVLCLRGAKLIAEIVDQRLNKDSQQARDLVALNAGLAATAGNLTADERDETVSRLSMTKKTLDTTAVNPDIFLTSGNDPLLSPLKTAMDQNVYERYATASTSLTRLIGNAQFDKASHQKPFEQICIIAGRINILTVRSVDLLEDFTEFCVHRVPQSIADLQAAGVNRALIINIITILESYCRRQREKVAQIQGDYDKTGRYIQATWNDSAVIQRQLERELTNEGIDLRKLSSQIGNYNSQLRIIDSAVISQNNIINAKRREVRHWQSMRGDICVNQNNVTNKINACNRAIWSAQNRNNNLRNQRIYYVNKINSANSESRAIQARMNALRIHIKTVEDMEVAVDGLLALPNYFEKFWIAWKTTFAMIQNDLKNAHFNVAAMIGSTADEVTEISNNWKAMGAVSQIAWDNAKLLPAILVPDTLPYPNQIPADKYEEHLDRLGFRTSEVLSFYDYFRLESVSDVQDFIVLNYGNTTAVEHVNQGVAKLSATLEYTFPLEDSDDGCVSICLYTADASVEQHDFLSVADADLNVGDIIRFSDPTWQMRGWANEWIEVKIMMKSDAWYQFQGTTDATYFNLSSLNAAVKWQPVRTNSPVGIGVESFDEFLKVEGTTPTEIEDDRSRKQARRRRATWKCVAALDGSPVPNMSLQSCYYTTEDAAGKVIRYYITHENDELSLLPAPAASASAAEKRKYTWKPRPSLTSGYLKSVADGEMDLLTPPHYYG